MFLIIDNGVNYKYVFFYLWLIFEFFVDWNFLLKLFNFFKILDKIFDYYYVFDFFEMFVENKYFFFMFMLDFICYLKYLYLYLYLYYVILNL